MAAPVNEPEAPAAAVPAATTEEIQATEVKAEGEVAVPAATPAATAAPTWVLQTTREQLPVSGDRLWHLSGSYEFRTLAITDPDPLSTMRSVWRVRADVDLARGTRAFLRLALTQNYSAEAEESGFLLQDTLLGAEYAHELALDFVPVAAFAGRKLDFVHRFGLFLPTSRTSMKQDMYASPYILSRARYAALPSLIIGLDAYVLYNFMRYAEQAGQYGGLNTQLDFGPSLGVEYTAWTSARWGEVSVGADLGVSYAKTYPSRENYTSSQSSQSFWSQDYGWDVFATYTPWSYATLVVGLEQGASVLRDGRLNIDPFHRDQTEFFLQLLGRY